MSSERRGDEDRARSDRVNKRLADMEKMKKAVDQTANRERLRKAQDLRVEEFLTKMGLVESLIEKEKVKEAEKVMTKGEAVKQKNKDRENKDIRDVSEDKLKNQKSDWVNSMDRNLKEDARKSGKSDTNYRDAMKSNDKEKPMDKVAGLRKPTRMGNSLETQGLHMEADWSWDESDTEWQGTVERERENERKKQLKR